MKHPKTELLASWRDGFHIKNARFGTLIDGSDLDGAAQKTILLPFIRVFTMWLHRMPIHFRADAAFRDHKDFALLPASKQPEQRSDSSARHGATR